LPALTADDVGSDSGIADRGAELAFEHTAIAARWKALPAHPNLTER